MKLQQKIIFLVMAGMLVGFSSFLTINYKMMYKTTSSEIHEKLINYSINLTISIEKWLDDRLRMAMALAKQAEKLENRNIENVRTYLNLINDSANIDASMIYYKGKTLIHTDPNWALSPEEEEANIPYQTLLANNFQPAISKVFKSPINKIDNMIAVIAPFDKNSLATLVIEIKDVEDEVSKIKFEGGYAILVDNYKKILVHPNEKLKGKILSEVIPKLKWLEDKIFSKESGFEEFKLNGKNYVILYDTIKTTGWKVILNLEKEAAYFNLTSQTKKILLISISFFILGTIFITIIDKLHEYWREEIEKKRDEYEFILIHQSRMSHIGELISGMNHQLHQPLNSLSLLSSSMLSKLRNKTLDDNIIEENLIVSQKAISMMSTTINTFRNFYKANKNITCFSLETCIENVLQILYVEFSKKNISVKINNTLNDNFHLTSIENFIQQVLLVLLQNSKDALKVLDRKSQKKIEIKISIQNDLICIDVLDWAEGINKETESKLFNNIKSSKKNLGSGIGLYFARKIAREKLKGDLILIQSSNPTIFRFSFKKDLEKKEEDNAFTYS